MTNVSVDDAATRHDHPHAISDAVMAMTTDGVIVSRPGGEALRCNASGRRLLGLGTDEVIGRAGDGPLFEFYDEHGCRVPTELHPAALAEASGSDVDGWTYHVRLRSGERRLMSGDARVVRDCRGDVIATISRFRDITDDISSQTIASDDAARFRTAFERSPVALLVVDADGRFLDGNPALSLLLGVSESEIRSMDWIGLAERRLSEQLSARLAPPFREETEPEVLEFVRSDGTMRHGLTHVCPIRWPGTERAVLVQITDVTERVGSETRAQVLADQFEQVFATSPIGMGVIGPDGTWTRVNRSLARYIGLIEADMEGSSPLDHVHPDDRDLLNRFASRALQDRPAAVDHRVITASGEIRWHRTQLTGISSGGCASILAQTMDQTAERRSEFEMRAVDRVTGLLSQKGIAAEIEHTMLVSRQSGDAFALICVDIDGFRGINDRLGVDAADRLLECVGVTTQAAMPLDGSIGRVHGDVFVGVASIRSHHDTKRALESVQRALQGVTPRGETEPITCRLGAIFVDGCDADPYDLLSAAEQAAHAAAQVAERFVIQTRTATGATTGSASDSWYHEVEDALNRNRLLVVGEQIEPIGAASPRHRYEMLVRLLLASDVRVSMPRFERYAQRLGLAAHVDQWVLRKAGEFLVADDLGEVEVNLSLTTITDPDTIRVIESEIEDRGMDPARLLLALDEEVVADALADVLDFALDARALGVGFCVDNYWLSHHGLRLVETIGARRVKLPSSVMRDAGDVADSVLLRSTIQSARDMGVEVAVPFITDRNAFERARELGVDYVQGRFVGAAIEID